MGKFKPEPVWTCEGKYNDEDKAACKNEVIKILKQCKKEHILINSPAMANLIYVNRLNKRKESKEDNDSVNDTWGNDPIEETLPQERLPQAKEIEDERLDINKTVSIVSKEKEHISEKGILNPKLFPHFVSTVSIKSLLALYLVVIVYEYI